MQGTQVRSLVQEDHTGLRATKPVSHNYWAHVLQQEKPQQWGAHAPQLESNLCSPQLEKAHMQQQRPSTANIYIYIYILKSLKN